MNKLNCLLTFSLTGICLSAAEPVAAPYVDSAAVRERFETITASDMDGLRGKKILFASRSFGLNLLKGLKALAREDSKYDLVSSYEKFDVFKAGGDVGIIPQDAFQKHNFVHFLATYHPHPKRLKETNALLRDTPHEFGKSVDVVVIFYHTATPALFDEYTAMMESWSADFPNARFIYVTSGFMGPKYAEENEASHEFGEMIRNEFRGKMPLYDLAALLSDDFRCGHVYCPEYSADPAEVHPNLPAGELMMAKGFLLVLKEALSRKPAAPVAALLKTREKSVAAVEALPASHPDAQAVRAILDANGLTSKAVDGVSVVENGRVVELFLQEGGIREIPEAIGALTALRKLHVYGDRSLNLPLLKTISPEIGRCVGIEELLLNQNDLATMPPEITRLQRLRNFSIAENRLHNLPPAVEAWVKRHDSKGLENQLPAL